MTNLRGITTTLTSALLLSVLTLTTGVQSDTAHAATPPDSCFAFNSGTGTITDYYNNEGNNIANPACTRDVDIPSTIGGNSVTNIGPSAFNSNQLISVTIPGSVTTIGTFAFAFNQLVNLSIPNSVTAIGNSAFQNNQLTAVTILSTNTSIGSWAFGYNQLSSAIFQGDISSIGANAFYSNKLTSVLMSGDVNSIGSLAFSYNQLTTITIPNSVTTIGFGAFAVQSQWGGDLDSGANGAPDFWSNDPVEVQTAYDGIWYVRLHTEDTTNPNNLVNSILNEDWWQGSDANANGTNDSLGGHLINPASAELQYVNSSNARLQTSQLFTGVMAGSHLTNYMVTQGPVVPIPADPENPTPTEQTAIDQALSAYYRIGDSVTIDPPAIDGYITPETQTFVLGAADNTFSYVYSQPASATPGTGTGAGDSDGELANTGAPMALYVASALAMSTTGAYALLRKRR